MSTQYRLVQSGKTTSGGCSAGQGSSEPVAPRIYLFIIFYFNTEYRFLSNSHFRFSFKNYAWQPYRLLSGHHLDQSLSAHIKNYLLGLNFGPQ
jgi:hypothetical protein